MISIVSSFRVRLVLSVLFVTVQIFSLAHAAEYGNESHQHDGIECLIASVSTADVAVPKQLPSSFTYFRSIQLNYKVFLDLLSWSHPPGRAPPPRGPPTV